MGNNASSSSTHKLLINQREPLSFHNVHSEHIRISNDGKTAQRVESFCKGICFSARPVVVGETVSIRCSHISTNWSGFLRVGFTSINPSGLFPSVLPRYACPDMTNQPGNWAKALPERFGVVNNVITYYTNRVGDVHIALNGEDIPGPFFSGVSVSGPLWALIDIYGNATGVEFVDRTYRPPAPSISPAPDAPVRRQPRKTPIPVNQPGPTSIPFSLPSKHYPRVNFQPLRFHDTTGKRVTINAEKSVATRHPEEYANAYAFTERPLNVCEKVVVQVLAMDPSFSGGLTVGITSCDPSTLRKADFPDDSDQLLDRLEYWVVHKDVITSAEAGDELSFTLTPAGELQFSRNGHTRSSPTIIMVVDLSVPIWLFWDLYGVFSQIKLFGAVRPKSRSPAPPPVSERGQPQSWPTETPQTSSAPSLTVELPPIEGMLIGAPPIPPRLQRINSAGGATGSSFATDSLVSFPVQVEPEADEAASDNLANECTVCFEKPCDCVIYTCGHMCVCYDCALSVKASSDPLCPICRQPIVDVIRIYKS